MKSILSVFLNCFILCISPLAIIFTSIIPEYLAGSMVASFYSTS
nr:MAG TPA: hypothetical protein [Bacteriophage sp.]